MTSRRYQTKHNRWSPVTCMFPNARPAYLMCGVPFLGARTGQDHSYSSIEDAGDRWGAPLSAARVPAGEIHGAPNTLFQALRAVD